MGYGTSGPGVRGQSDSGDGVVGMTTFGKGNAGLFLGKVRVQGGNVFITSPNSLIITSPDAKCWQIKVSTEGVLSAASVACP